jgi:polar amino acid transport system substrate-binding protein
MRATLTFLAVALGIGLAACSPGHEATLQRVRRTGVLRVGTDATYPPFETIDPASGRLAGFDVDLVRALAGRLPARVEFVVVPFDGIVPGLKSDKYDLIISAMTITPERARQVLFTEPYTVAGQSIVARSAAAAIRGPADLAGLRIGCQLATTGEMEAKKVPGARVVSYDAIGAAFRDLENGNLDAAIADTPTARIFIRDHPTLRLAGAPLTREEFGMAVRPADGDLAAALNAALAELRAGGEMDAIEERWGIAPGSVPR